MPASHRTAHVQQFAQEAPAFASLMRQIEVARARMDVIRPLLQPALRAQVQPGALGQESWSLLAPNAAAAARLRQQAPALLGALQRAGHEVERLDIKVRAPSAAFF